MSLCRIVPLVMVLLASSTGADVAPVGEEFQVNTFTAGDQSAPQVCTDATGRFTVAWQSGNYSFPDGPDGSRRSVAARPFDPNGVPQGGEFIANTYTLGPQAAPAIASAPSGEFVVAWQGGSFDYPQDGSESGAFLQRFSAAGVPLGGEHTVNTTTAGSQGGVAVSTDPAGDFVVVWTSYPAYYGTRGGDGDRSGVFGQRFDGTGMPLGPEFQVNTYTTGSQSSPRVASDTSGGFVVVWQSGSYYGGQDGDRSGVFARRYDATGNAVGGEFQVNTYTTGYQAVPDVAHAPSGGFVVVWESGSYPGPDGDRSGVFAQRLDEGGAPVGGEFQVNSYTRGAQNDPAVACDGGGNFTVVWTSSNYPVGQDGSAAGIFGQHFAAGGEPLGDEFAVNTYTTGSQFSPAISASPGGDFVVVWTSNGFGFGTPQDGDGSGVFARRLRTTRTSPPPRLRGERLVLRDDLEDPRGRRLALRSRDVGIEASDTADGDPVVGGATLRLSSPMFDDTYPLPAANWRRRGDTWEYRDRALLSGPITQVVVRSGKLRISGKGAQLQHLLTSNPDPVSVVLRLGSRRAPQCLWFGGSAEFRPGRLFRARNAPPPASCR